MSHAIDPSASTRVTMAELAVRLQRRSRSWGRRRGQRGASEPGRGTGREGGVSFTDAASETPTKSTTATLVAYETTCIEPETMIVGVDKVALVVMSAKAEITRPGRRASLSP